MRSRREIALIVVAALAIVAAGAIAIRSLWGGGRPVPVDSELLEAEREMTDQMEREAPPPAESNAPPPQREPSMR